MTDDAGFRHLAFVALLVAVWLEAFQWVVTRVFVLNFSTAGPNATVLLTLLLVTGWTVPVAARWSSACATGNWFGLAILGLGVSLAADPVLAALSGVAAVTGLTTVLVASLSDLRARFAVGAGTGIAVHAGVRVWLDTAPTYATSVGQWVLATLVAAAVGVWWLLAREDARPTLGEVSVPLAPLGTFLVAQATVLGAFPSLSTWAPRPYGLTAGLGIAGALAGALLVERPGVLAGGRLVAAAGSEAPASGRRAAVAWGLLLVVSLAALLWLDILGLPFVFVTQASAVALLGIGSRTGESRRPLAAGAELAAAQFVAVLVVFLAVSAANWAYLPAPLSGLVRGRTAAFLVLLGALVALSVVLTARARGSPSRPDGDDRRTVLSMLGAGALGLAGLGVRGRGTPGSDRTGPTADRGAPPVRTMTYNVHQYFSRDGAYNLRPVLAVLREAEAHVVGLQETEGARITSGNLDGVRWLARRLGYHYTYGVPTADGGYGVSLLSAWPIENERTIRLPTNDSPARWALVADLQTSVGDLTVAVTHFQTDQPDPDRRAESADLLVEELGDADRAVVMGDFNATPGEPTYETMASAFTDAWTAAGHPRDSGPTASASDPSHRIDYVWLRGDWTVHDARRLGTPRASDHLAVLAAATPE